MVTAHILFYLRIIAIDINEVAALANHRIKHPVFPDNAAENGINAGLDLKILAEFISRRKTDGIGPTEPLAQIALRGDTTVIET